MSELSFPGLTNAEIRRALDPDYDNIVARLTAAVKNNSSANRSLSPVSLGAAYAVARAAAEAERAEYEKLKAAADASSEARKRKGVSRV